MTIRRAKLADLRQLMSLDLLAHTDKERRAWLKQAIREHSVWLLTAGPTIKAYGVARRNFFQRVFIEMLYVAVAARRQGCATRLLARLEIAGLRRGEVWTSTNRSNRAMRQLLKKRGYERSGRISGLDDGDPEIFYVKRTIARLL